MTHSVKPSRLFYPDFIRVTAFLCILLFHFQVETSHYAGFFRGIIKSSAWQEPASAFS